MVKGQCSACATRPSRGRKRGSVFEERMRELRRSFPGRRKLRPSQVAAYLKISVAHALVRFRWDPDGLIPITRLARTLERET